MKKKLAFTLSEILITLVIIGIIAAITIPSVSQYTQKQQFKSALKKNFSVLKQALIRYQVENDEMLLPNYIVTSQQKNLYHSLRPYLNIMYDCGQTRLNSLCVPVNGADINNASNQKIYKTYDGKSSFNFNLIDDGQYVLNDGSILLFEGNSSIEYQIVSVDVNGFGKKPNVLGKDLFMFQLMENGQLLPMGAKGTLFPNNKYCSSGVIYMNGAGCTSSMLTSF